jgi:hypothetical protein
MDHGTVEAMMAFQRQETDFGAVWQDIQPVVEKSVRRELRKWLVRGHKTAQDEAAIDDTLQQDDQLVKYEKIQYDLSEVAPNTKCGVTGTFSTSSLVHSEIKNTLR